MLKQIFYMGNIGENENVTKTTINSFMVLPKQQYLAVKNPRKHPPHFNQCTCTSLSMYFTHNLRE